MRNCCYKKCEIEATVNGFVLTRNPLGGTDIPMPVQACDKHKKIAGFFETITKEGSLC